MPSSRAQYISDHNRILHTAGSGRGRTQLRLTAPVTAPVPSPVTTSRVTAVTVSALTARTDGKGVLISWKTGHEVNNLGFHVWREEAGQRIRLTREPLAGGALTVGNTHVDAGHSYSFMMRFVRWQPVRVTVLRGGY